MVAFMSRTKIEFTIKLIRFLRKVVQIIITNHTQIKKKVIIQILIKSVVQLAIQHLRMNLT